jgi:hypothetical protein
MDTSTLVSGFIGSFLGVSAGFLGAVYLDWRHSNRQRRAHILALMREILSNNVRIQLVLKEGRREGPLDDRAWQELRVPLAGELPPELYNRIASRYDGFAQSRKSYEELSNGNVDEEKAEALGEWADAFMEESEWLRAEVDDRAEGLLRALNRRTRRQEERQKKAQAGEVPTEVGKRR